ncbi:MAG: hypothetical protein IJC75_03970 [Oscillospiraceae bacterium]|nr:hypothetical protein [Oscillospiraceae bacterium]
MKPGKTEYPSVHRGILLAAAAYLQKESHPAASFYTKEDLRILADEVVKPDEKGDRQRGSGYHYYCAVNPKGKANPFVQGDYYPNGRGKKAPSARTMFEEEYTAAAAAMEQGSRSRAMAHLGRAAHMLADVYCPPHSCGLTYLTRYAKYHKQFETIAARKFWADVEAIGEKAVLQRAAFSVQELPQATAFEKIPQQGAGQLFNSAAQKTAAVLPSVLSKDPSAAENAVQLQLAFAIGATAALLAAFAEQSTLQL